MLARKLGSDRVTRGTLGDRDANGLAGLDRGGGIGHGLDGGNDHEGAYANERDQEDGRRDDCGDGFALLRRTRSMARTLCAMRRRSAALSASRGRRRQHARFGRGLRHTGTLGGCCRKRFPYRCAAKGARGARQLGRTPARPRLLTSGSRALRLGASSGVRSRASAGGVRGGTRGAALRCQGTLLAYRRLSIPETGALRALIRLRRSSVALADIVAHLKHLRFFYLTSFAKRGWRRSYRPCRASVSR